MGSPRCLGKTASTAREQRVARNSYVLLPPAPASAAAFLTEIGIRPFSQNIPNTKQLFANLGPLASSPPPTLGRCRGSRAPALPTTLEAPLHRPRPRSPLPRRPRQPRTGRKVTSPPASGPGLYRGSAAPSGGCWPRVSPRGPTRAAAAPAPGSLLTSLPHRAEPARAAEIAVQPRRRRRPCPGLSQAGRLPSGSARAGGGGGEPGTATGPGAVGLGRREGRGGSFRTAAASSGSPTSAAPGSQSPAGTTAPSSTGDRCPRRSAPAPGPARDSLRNPIPPPPARPPEPQYLQISPGQRLAPLRACPPPSPSGPRCPTLFPCAPTDCLPRVAAAAAPTPFLCCWTFGGGEGDWGKVGRRGPRDPVCGRGAGSDFPPQPCRRSSPRRPGLGPAASAALGFLLSGELAGAAHSSTGRCAAHPARAAARPPDTPPRRPRAPADTPPTRPRAWPLGAPRPSAPGLGADSEPD